MEAPLAQQPVVYGEWGGTLIFMDREHAEDLARLRETLNTAKTWGELWSRLPLFRFREIINIFANDDDDPGGVWGYYLDLVAEDDTITLEEAGARYYELPCTGRQVHASESFNANDIHGYADKDWPEWPAQHMLYWVPAEIREGFGKVSDSNFNGEFLLFEQERVAEIVAAFGEFGYVCVRDDELIARTYG
jgi:hypothetical protein